MENAQDTTLKIFANSPGKYPIVVVELPSGELRTTYFETDYDLDQGKTVEEDWLRDNAIGRHSFVEVDPPREVAASDLKSHVRKELLRD